jgi:hypothetical protein
LLFSPHGNYFLTNYASQGLDIIRTDAALSACRAWAHPGQSLLATKSFETLIRRSAPILPFFVAIQAAKVQQIVRCLWNDCFGLGDFLVAYLASDALHFDRFVNWNHGTSCNTTISSLLYRLKMTDYRTLRNTGSDA